MNAERFEELAWAYGGDIRRWPLAVQGEAFVWLQGQERARDVLVEAGSLDAMLNASAPMSASGILRERILASAPKPRPAFQRGVTWFSGAGLAAACAAGIFLGATKASLFMAPAAVSVAQAGHSATHLTPAAATQAVSVSPTRTTTNTAAETAGASATGETAAAPDVYYGGAWFSGLESEG